MASKNSWLIIVLPLLMTCSSPAKLSRIRNNDRRSSIISITKGHVLTGHVIHKQRTYDIMTCAQLCLARLKCTSFNYENTRNGICELNRKSLDGDMVVGKNVLSSKKGHLFSQLIDLSVSIATLGARGFFLRGFWYRSCLNWRPGRSKIFPSGAREKNPMVPRVEYCSLFKKTHMLRSGTTLKQNSKIKQYVSSVL